MKRRTMSNKRGLCVAILVLAMMKLLLYDIPLLTGQLFIDVAKDEHGFTHVSVHPLALLVEVAGMSFCAMWLFRHRVR